MIRRVVPQGEFTKAGPKSMRWLWIAAVAIPLSGCALPPAVSIASVAIDVASYAASGKSVTDHGISLVLQRDCALLRVLEGRICRDGTADDTETALAALEPLSDSQIAPASDDPMSLPPDLAYLAGPTGVVAAGYPETAEGPAVSHRAFAEDAETVAAAGPARPPSAADDALAAAAYLADGARPSGPARALASSFHKT
ncbi:MAG: hypothetical protein ACE5KF_02435 [Kiloniellaceae bacterium]